MGFCHEFGVAIASGCDHAMVAGRTACSCPECGTVCTGRFGGCAAVWARGPVDLEERLGLRAEPLLPPLLPDPPAPVETADASDEPGRAERLIDGALAALSASSNGNGAANGHATADLREAVARVETIGGSLSDLVDRARQEIGREMAAAAEARAAAEAARTTFDRSHAAFQEERAGMAHAVSAIEDTRRRLDEGIAAVDERVAELRDAAGIAHAAADAAARAATAAADVSRAGAEDAQHIATEAARELDARVAEIDELTARQEALIHDVERLVSSATELQEMTKSRLGRIPTDIDATSFTEFRKARSRIARIEPLAWFTFVVAVVAVVLAVAAFVAG